MRIKQEYVDWRGLWIGEYDEYAKGVQGVLRRSMKMRFISTDILEDLVEKCYTYEPSLIVFPINEATLDMLDGVRELKRFRRSVSIGLTEEADKRMKSMVSEKLLTELIIKTGDARRDGTKVYHALVRNMRYGVNLNTIMEKMPVSGEVEWHDVSFEIRRTHDMLSDKLADLGVRKHLKGHKYLIAAIAMQSLEFGVPDLEKIYERIADYYEVTPKAVEKAIRYAIETAWVNGDIRYQHAMFGMSIDEERGKPTNAEFIARLAVDIDR